MNTNFQSIMNTSKYNMATPPHMTALDGQRVFVGILLALNLVLFAAMRWEIPLNSLATAAVFL